MDERSKKSGWRGPGRKRAKLNEADAVEIRAMFEDEAYTRAELAAEFGVSVSCIQSVISGRTWPNAGKNLEAAAVDSSKEGE